MTSRTIPRMTDWTSRRMTLREAALARIVFAEEIDYARVRIVQLGPVFPGAVVPFGREIVFSGWRAAIDFAEAGTSEQGWFVHELAHVWQATRRGIVLAVSKLACLRAKDYAVAPKAGKPFSAFNIEAQAEIARHAWHERAGVRLSAPEARAIAALWPVAASTAASKA